MELVLVLFKQIIVMMILMGVGYFLFKTKKITLEGNKELGMFLIYIILPASIIKSYITELTKEKFTALLVSFLAAFLTLLVSVIISRLIFGNRQKIEHFGTAFSNAGFMGIPLVKVTVGDQAVFYVAAFVAFLNILQWTYGVFVMSGEKEAISLKKIITNPVVISLVIGLGIFFVQIPVHSILTETLGIVGNMTAPVAMVTLGVYFAQLNLKELFNEKWAYISMIVRLFIIPIASIFILLILPEQFRDVRLSVLIAAAAPVGSNVAIFAQLNNLDYKRAVKSVCMSTLASIISMPLIVGLAQLVW